MCQSLCFHFRINSGEPVVSSSFTEKPHIWGCVFHSEQDYQLMLRISSQGPAPSVLKMQSQHLKAEFPSVFPHLSVPRKSLQFTYTHLGGGMSTPSSHSPQHACSGFTDPPNRTNINSLLCYFWKVPGRSFERKIKVLCLIYSALGISPSRQYGWECTRLTFLCSAASSSNSLQSLQTQKLQTCHVIHTRPKCRISTSFHEHTKHQDCSTAQNLNWEETPNDSYVLGKEGPEGHKAKCGKERTELRCCQGGQPV